MMKQAISLVVATAAAVAIASAQGNVLVINHVTLIDGTGRAPVANATVVVEGGTIKAAGEHAQAPAGARTIDGTGKFLIPGLIDAHIHLRGGRGGNRSAADQDRDGIRALHSYLYAGVTTVFDAGNRPEFITGLRDRERGGAIVSPRIFATGGTVASPNAMAAPTTSRPGLAIASCLTRTSRPSRTSPRSGRTSTVGARVR